MWKPKIRETNTAIERVFIFLLIQDNSRAFRLSDACHSASRNAKAKFYNFL